MLSFVIIRDRIRISTTSSEFKRRNSQCTSGYRYKHNRHQNQRHKLFHEIYLLRFFFRSFSLCYPLSCGILLMNLVNYIAYGDGSPPAKFTRIIFVYLPFSSHWYHLLVLKSPNLFGTVKYYAQIHLQVWQNSVCTGQGNLPLIT